MKIEVHKLPEGLHCSLHLLLMLVGQVVADVAVFDDKGLRVSLTLAELLVPISLDSLEQGIEN